MAWDDTSNYDKYRHCDLAGRYRSDDLIGAATAVSVLNYHTLSRFATTLRHKLGFGIDEQDRVANAILSAADELRHG